MQEIVQTEYKTIFLPISAGNRANRLVKVQEIVVHTNSTTLKRPIQGKKLPLLVKRRAISAYKHIFKL